MQDEEVRICHAACVALSFDGAVILSSVQEAGPKATTLFLGAKFIDYVTSSLHLIHEVLTCTLVT